MAEHNIDQFTYIKDLRRFVVEASDLGHRVGDKFAPSIQIYNPSTGNLAYFCFEKANWNDDNELVSWYYACHEYCCSLLVYND